jgi:hypothetical protein
MKEGMVTLKKVRIVGPSVALLAFVLLGCPNQSSSQSGETRENDATVENTEARADAVKNDDQERSGRRTERTPFKGSGKAVFPEAEHDFGEVDEGASVSHVFKVRNESEEVLHIKRVRGS